MRLRAYVEGSKGFSLPNIMSSKTTRGGSRGASRWYSLLIEKMTPFDIVVGLHGNPRQTKA